MSDFRPKTGPKAGRRQPAEKRNGRFKRGLGGSLAVIVFAAAVSACGSDDKSAKGDKGDKDKPAASAPASTSAEASHKAAPTPTHKAKPTTVLALKGFRTKNTSAFMVGGEWTLSYTFDCTKAMAAVDGKGNFIVFEKNDKLVNELGKTGKGSIQQHTPGTHQLQIISECDWTVKVTG
ncbi:hypothetical protein [Streptomyces sp. MST-110588]|uniref:hypothetical protein n=1 Tax=Streptomyces sp. MST-110588 TaxID=2833628 RepID=UPI001F5C168E|nr:hypothetical protein [Streptomyces sp. MST-110588]UNO42519.1 hypothetical protein KGS77_27070 [Streptomyces sp. MST-110588]